MTAGRDPVDRVVDVMVGVPVSLAVATRRALPMITRAGRRRLARLTERGGVISPTAGSGPARDRDTVADVAEHDHSTAAGADAAVADAVDDLPIEGYDHLAARQVCDRLAGLTPAELERVADYERAHRARRTVLGKIEQLRS